MSENKFTPGPWTWYQPGSTPAVNPYGAAFVLGPKRVPMDRSEGFTISDARLISAAPDLLETLESLIATLSEPDEQICCNGHHCGCMGSTKYQQAEYYAKEAIARAKGESN